MTEVSTRHPEISKARQAEWLMMRDSEEGESAIKGAGETYLPKPSGFDSLGQKDGLEAYDAYKVRADFPEIVGPSLAGMIGMIHDRDAQITVPGAMEFIFERATRDGDTLDELHRRVTRNLLHLGRYGLLADAPVGGGDAFLSGYAAERTINWDANFFVLDETGLVRDGFDWEEREEYRVLQFIDGAYVATLHGENGSTEAVTPTALGNRSINRIPYAVGNAINQRPDVIVPPLVGVARAAVSGYRLSADYRWQLYMSGQETLVAINGDAPEAVGAGVVHEMKGSPDQRTIDLKYVSPTCKGIEAHRTAIEDTRIAAIIAGARLVEGKQEVPESGAAKRLRFASETATIMSVAVNSAALLERGLRNVAMLMGLNEDEVVVEPPRDLMDHTIEPAQAMSLVQAWQGNAISFETLYENLQRGGIASPERNFEEELEKIDQQSFVDEEPEIPELTE